MDDDRNHYAETPRKHIKDQENGRLTIFLGAAPGVGKTHAMLNAAHERRQEGVSVLVGLVETHGKQDTADLLKGLAILPRKEITYHNSTHYEFDLDNALKQKPQLILVDELAHTNSPGSRNKRRYQDISELLNAGIDVYTCINIQHLASLNDLIHQITNVHVPETVPDRFIDDAYELLFIDLPADTLIKRLQQGKVHVPEYARADLDAFFSRSHLTALRELAVRKVINGIENRLSDTLTTSNKRFPMQEKLLVLVSHNSNHEYLIRIARQIADRRKTSWTVVWVDTGRVRTQHPSPEVQSAFSLARELGGDTLTLQGNSTYETISTFIQEHRIKSVLVGSRSRHKLKFWKKRLYQQLIESDVHLEVSVIRDPQTPQKKTAQTRNTGLFKGALIYHAYALLAVMLATAIAIPLEAIVANTNLVLVFVLSVIAVALKYGWRPAITASILSFICFNFFFTEPRYTLHVTKQDELATLFFLLIIALICGPAASQIRRQFILLRDANRYSETMRFLGEELSIAENPDAIWKATHKVIVESMPVECVIVPRDDEQSTWPPIPPNTFQQIDISAIEWSQRNLMIAGRHSDTLNASEWTFFPIFKDKTCIACAALKFTEPMLLPWYIPLIQAITQQSADTWRRTQLVKDLEAARVKTEIQQLRSALLSSVSHDLKSPPAAMMGAAESLQLLDHQLEPQDRNELTETIVQESRRLDSYIQNLLDMTRLGYGTLKIERDWVSVADIVASALSRLKRYFPKISVLTFFHSDPDLFVHAALIEQALFNIMENAARFTPENESIEVSINSDDHHCFIGIKDKGPGIPDDLLEKIFDMFFVIADGDKKKQSTGMGLAICRGMIGAHGGKVYARSNLGSAGTLFTVELPLSRPNNTNSSYE